MCHGLFQVAFSFWFPSAWLGPACAVLFVFFFCSAVQTAWSRRGNHIEQEVKSCQMPPRSSSCAGLFQHCACEDSSFVAPPSPLFLFQSLPPIINCFFTVLRRAAQLLLTITHVSQFTVVFMGASVMSAFMKGSSLSGTDHVTRRCIDLVAGVSSWYHLSQRP